MINTLLLSRPRDCKFTEQNGNLPKYSEIAQCQYTKLIILCFHAFTIVLFIIQKRNLFNLERILKIVLLSCVVYMNSRISFAHVNQMVLSCVCQKLVGLISKVKVLILIRHVVVNTRFTNVLPATNNSIDIYYI